LREGEIHWPRRIKTVPDAIRFIDAAGFCLLFPIKNVALPSLYFAMARRVPVTWDSYAVKLWEWKARIPRRRLAFYAKYFKGRGTFISLEYLPHFLAMRDSAAGPADQGRFYSAGRISYEACAIWQALDEHGPLATLELRHACKLDSKAGNVRFKKAMTELQGLLIVTHFGAEQETAAWASGRFELTSRAFPKKIEQARHITAADARAILARKYLEWHPGASRVTLARLFGWTKAEPSPHQRQRIFLTECRNQTS
jgi:hypothetical protein